MMAIDPSAIGLSGVAASLQKAIVGTKPTTITVKTPEEIADAFRAAAAKEAELLANEQRLNGETCPYCSDPESVFGECFCTRQACLLPECPALRGPMSVALLPVPTFLPRGSE